MTPRLVTALLSSLLALLVGLSSAEAFKLELKRSNVSLGRTKTNLGNLNGNRVGTKHLDVRKRFEDFKRKMDELGKKVLNKPRVQKVLNHPVTQKLIKYAPEVGFGVALAQVGYLHVAGQGLGSTVLLGGAIAGYAQTKIMIWAQRLRNDQPKALVEKATRPSVPSTNRSRNKTVRYEG